MKKFLTKDTLILVVLFALMLAWGPVYQKFFAPPPPKAKPVIVSGVASNEAVASPVVSAVVSNGSLPQTEAVSVAIPEIRQPTQVPRQPESLVELTNGLVRLTLSSHGGCVKSVELPAFALTKTNTAPVILDFGNVPALAYGGLSGLDEGADFTVSLVSNGSAARLEAVTAAGIGLTRTISLGNRYEVTVDDVFTNTGRESVGLPAHSLSLGSMGMLKDETAMSGVDFLCIDTMVSSGGNGVRHRASKRWFSDDLTLADYFQEMPRRGSGCVGRAPMTRMLPLSIREKINGDMDWVAVKNKFFAQILGPKDGSAAGCDLIVERTRGPMENPSDSATWAEAAVPSRVAAAIHFAGRSLVAGETYHRSLSYYVGPKEFSSIAPLGQHKQEIMDFGMFRWLCEGLLWSLNKLYWLIPNYGIAIILLTLIVRIIFWPLTHKGTESMKRMQALQPQIKELQEKYRDKPQKLQQETMALYRENKVNPLGGCLPMLVQIPVFFALFNVLRSAVELRFAPFLWVKDLSAAENLLVGISPIPINLLPILMTVTQIWQQKLTPAAGDPAQQKMMMWMMPIMMLMFLYSMPAALVLYWTANQVMMIIQLYWQRRIKKV
ncbi:MAG: YidC/Oxa1 family insertase periplasmic-domain containing protein [bacterium]